MLFFITLWDLLNMVRNVYHNFYQFENMSNNIVTHFPLHLSVKRCFDVVT
jgi:hypothetical protein